MTICIGWIRVCFGYYLFYILWLVYVYINIILFDISGTYFLSLFFFFWFVNGQVRVSGLDPRVRFGHKETRLKPNPLPFLHEIGNVERIMHLKLFDVAKTWFASTLVMLKRLKIIRSLQNMVICEQWSAYREDDVGKEAIVRKLVLNDLW